LSFMKSILHVSASTRPSSVRCKQRYTNAEKSLIFGKWPTWRANSFLSIFSFITPYMFRALRAHHQERQIVSIQLLVTVTLCEWPCHV
jgi:hypothetical protein